MSRLSVGAVSLAVVIGAAGCSGNDADARKAAASTSPGTAAPRSQPATCAMLTAAEMTDMVGTPVEARGEEGGGTTTCQYKPASAAIPSIEVAIDWGGGGPALAATGMLGRLEPGMTNPLAGLGDQAARIGPALWVRTGDDLVRLTFFGAGDDDVPLARRIVDRLRPRMGPSAQSSGATNGDTGGHDRAQGDDVAKAADVVGGLLGGLAARLGGEAPKAAGAEAKGIETASPTGDEATFVRATGAVRHVPLVAGLTLVGAEHEPKRGDYEPIVTVTTVTEATVATAFSANLPEGNRLSVARNLSRSDLRIALSFRSWYEAGDPPVFDGTTSFSVSAAVLDALKTKGQVEVVRVGGGEPSLATFATLLAGKPSPVERHAGVLRRVEPFDVAFPVLLNDAPTELHAVHARGTFEDATIDFHFLDDPENPVLLRVAGGSVGRIVSITYPEETARPRLEKALTEESRVALHGIYFDFGKATLRPESEPVLREIAAALARHSDWVVVIEGHTDNIGDETANESLSRRRADAVKDALVTRHRVPAQRLSSAGFGSSHPATENNTLAGRARNRRVELVRR